MTDDHNVPQGRLPLRLTDLLLILILTLGAARFLIPLLVSFLGVGGGSAGPGSGTVLLLLAAQTALLLAIVYLIAVRGRGVQWAQLGFRPLSMTWRWRALLIGVVAFPLVTLVSWAQMQLTGAPLNNPQMDVLAPPTFSWSSYALMLLIAGVLAPLAEETAFRGLLYGWLRERLGIGLAMLGSALAFSVMHGIPALIPAIVVLGVILAWVYEKTGSIWAPVIVHGLYNAIVTTIIYAAVAQGISLPGGG